MPFTALESLGGKPVTPLKIRPNYTAALISGSFLLISVLYIFVSGYIASRVSLSVQHMAAIEMAKGVSFMVLISVLLFWVIRRMLSRLRDQQERIHVQQMALMEAEKKGAAGAFAASVAHDISNVLVVCQYAVTDLEKLDHNARVLSSIDDLKNANKRLDDLSQQLHKLASGNTESGLKYINFSQVIDKAVSFSRMHADVRRCNVVTDIEPSIVLLADEQMTLRVVLNLMVNAGQAVGREGRIRVVLSTVDHSVVLEVHDDGPGIDPSIREQVLEPMYTTKPAGTGLGLLSLRFFLEKHRGEVRIHDSEMGGACFRILLPKQSALGPGR
jgi:signal transduction histidine kinase